MAKIFRTVNCENCESLKKSVFCSLKNSPLSDASSNKVMNFYKKGQTLYFQGNPAFGIYCINSGKIKVSKMENDGKEIILRIAGAGDILGHQNLYTNENYTATATIIEDAAICFLDKKFVLNIISTEPSISINIISKMSNELSTYERRNAAMSHKNVRERLAELLLALKINYGIFEHGRFKLDIKLTREEMASMVGTANETIIRFISEFKDEGILEQEGKIIYIMNIEKLIKTANIAP